MKIDIPKGTENGKVFRLKGLGMPKFGKEKEYGDLYARTNVIIPKNLSEEEIKLFRQLSKIKEQQLAQAQ